MSSEVDSLPIFDDRVFRLTQPQKEEIPCDLHLPLLAAFVPFCEGSSQPFGNTSLSSFSRAANRRGANLDVLLNPPASRGTSLPNNLVVTKHSAAAMPRSSSVAPMPTIKSRYLDARVLEVPIPTKSRQRAMTRVSQIRNSKQLRNELRERVAALALLKKQQQEGRVNYEKVNCLRIDQSSPVKKLEQRRDKLQSVLRRERRVRQAKEELDKMYTQKMLRFDPSTEAAKQFKRDKRANRWKTIMVMSLVFGRMFKRLLCVSHTYQEVLFGVYVRRIQRVWRDWKKRSQKPCVIRAVAQIYERRCKARTELRNRSVNMIKRTLQIVTDNMFYIRLAMVRLRTNVLRIQRGWRRIHAVEVARLDVIKLQMERALKRFYAEKDPVFDKAELAKLLPQGSNYDIFIRTCRAMYNACNNKYHMLQRHFTMSLASWHNKCELIVSKIMMNNPKHSTSEQVEASLPPKPVPPIWPCIIREREAHGWISIMIDKHHRSNMGQEYNMLGELGVTVPHEASRPPAASSEPKIVKPIARPPRASSCRPPADKRATIVVPTTPPPPGRSESGSVSRWREMPLSPTHPKYVTRQKARHESVFTEPADLMSPLGKTVYVKGPVGRLKEYEVYDATIPCNNAYNRMLSQKKAEETAMKVEAEQRQCDLAVAADLQSLRKEKEYVVAKRLKQKNEIEAWNEEKKARDEQKRRQDEYLDQKSRAIQDENYSRAVQDKLNELERQRSSKAQLRAELQRSMQEKHERLLQEEAARLKPHINGFEIGVGYHVTKEELKLRGDKLRKAWAEQQAQKAAEMEVERHRDYRLAMNTARAAELERQAMFEEKLATRDRNEQTRFEQQLFMKQKAERDNEDRHRLMQADRQRVERDRQENLAAREYEATMSQIKKETFKESLAHQMDVKAAADAIKAAKDSGPHMAHNGLGMREERKILFRCPITNQLLPPTAFNIKTTTSRPRIVVP